MGRIHGIILQGLSTTTTSSLRARSRTLGRWGLEVRTASCGVSFRLDYGDAALRQYTMYASRAPSGNPETKGKAARFLYGVTCLCRGSFRRRAARAGPLL
eukprot:4654823-Prymnesium_polylepis.1